MFHLSRWEVCGAGITCIETVGLVQNIIAQCFYRPVSLSLWLEEFLALVRASLQVKGAIVDFLQGDVLANLGCNLHTNNESCYPSFLHYATLHWPCMYSGPRPYL